MRREQRAGQKENKHISSRKMAFYHFSNKSQMVLGCEKAHCNEPLPTTKQLPSLQTADKTVACRMCWQCSSSTGFQCLYTCQQHFCTLAMEYVSVQAATRIHSLRSCFLTKQFHWKGTVHVFHVQIPMTYRHRIYSLSAPPIRNKTSISMYNIASGHIYLSAEIYSPKFCITALQQSFHFF